MVNMNDRVVKERQNNLLADVQIVIFIFLPYTVQYVRPYFALISYVVCTYRIKYKYFDVIQTLKKQQFVPKNLLIKNLAKSK